LLLRSLSPNDLRGRVSNRYGKFFLDLERNEQKVLAHQEAFRVGKIVGKWLRSKVLIPVFDVAGRETN
jgi:hypothetical protein